MKKYLILDRKSLFPVIEFLNKRELNSHSKKGLLRNKVVFELKLTFKKDL